MPRNRKIAEALFMAGFIERWGSGTNRMVVELQRMDLPTPEFESTPERFRVLFHRQRWTDVQLKRLGLQERQVKAVTFVREHGQISNAKYQEIAQVSERTATRDLNLLITKDIFEPHGKKGRGAIYKLKAP